MRLVLTLGAVALFAACQPVPQPQPQPRPSYPTPGYLPPGIGAPAQPAPPPAAPLPTPAPQPSPVPPPPPPSDPSDTCGASAFQGFIGSVAPQPFPAPGPVRVYAQGDPVTMDHNPQRLNVVVDRQNRQRIVSLSCG